MSSSIMNTETLSAAQVQELLEKHRVTLLESLSKMLAAGTGTAASAAPAPAGKKSKKVKEVDPNAPPKEKRPPNSWILFAMRVEKLVRAAEVAEGKTTKETRIHTIVIKQFAASLKEKKAYDEWTDDEVVEELSTWTPPEVSKQAAAKAAKAVGAGAPAEPAAEDAAPAAESAPAAAEKPKRQWSEEAKAAAALKRAATKAAKAAGVAVSAAPGASGGEEKPAEKPAAEPAAAPAAAKKMVIKPKAAPAPAPEKPVDLSFYSWTHEGKSYYTNDRGDVVTTDFEWVGRFSGTKIDESVAEPEDLSSATLRE